MDPLEDRLRAALAGTGEAKPRPVVSLKLERMLTPGLLASLRPASVLVPVMRRKDGPTVLMTVRPETMRSHGGQVSFPGGRREESDSSAAAAALREAHEEVGIPPSAVEVIGYLDDYPTLTRYLITPVVGVVEDLAEVQAHVHEVAEIFEVPLAFLLERANFRQKKLAGTKLPYYEVTFGRFRIWGATAGMLWDLAHKVHEHGPKNG